MNELIEIKTQLEAGHQLRTGHKIYLMDAIDRIQSGESIEAAFKNAHCPNDKRGKNSIQYQAAKKSRDEKLRRAFGLLEGKAWNRCYQLESHIYVIQAKIEAGDFEPQTEVERLILRAIKTGVPLPTTAKGIHAAIFKD